jgi:GTPase SAR1 family protein
MSSYKIAICGTPQVGKRTLLMQIGQHTGHKHVNRRSETEPNAYLTVPHASTDLEFAAGCGSYLNPEPMIQVLLSQASVVIYVLSPAFSTNGRPHVDDEEHYYYLNLYLRYARDLKVGWEHVPWLVVLNKTDLASNLPAEAKLFPDTLLQNYVRCIASEGKGVPKVWESLLRVL